MKPSDDRQAIRGYRLENGALPESLIDLILHGLSEVPRDPLGGKALRYSRELAHVWSIGIDAMDQGGITRVTLLELGERRLDRWLDLDDPTLHIQFDRDIFPDGDDE